MYYYEDYVSLYNNHELMNVMCAYLKKGGENPWKRQCTNVSCRLASSHRCISFTRPRGHSLAFSDFEIYQAILRTVVSQFFLNATMLILL